MTKQNHLEIDAVTGEQIVIELTKEEIAHREELAIANEANRVAQEIAKSEAKAALLERLGITADEAALLIG